MNRVFIGFDPRQAVSYSTLAYSIAANAKEPVSITPLVLETLPLKRQGLTPFTWSRFLVPYLCGYQGLGLFLDADMLCLGDISEVFKCAIQGKPAYVVKQQPAFEWASMILFDCANPANAKLTPEYIETSTDGLHKMGWLARDEIGALPHEWNVCVPYAYPGETYPNGYQAPKEPPPSPKLLHYTQGVPAWWETEGQMHATAWLNYRDAAMGTTESWVKLMGRSVHADPVVARLKRDGVVKDERDYCIRAGLIKEAAE